MGGIYPRPIPAPEEAAAAERRALRHRWSAPAKSCVAHPKYGKILVPHRSNFSAICCAADAWGCKWTEILGAEVTAAEK